MRSFLRGLINKKLKSWFISPSTAIGKKVRVNPLEADNEANIRVETNVSAIKTEVSRKDTNLYINND